MLIEQVKCKECNAPIELDIDIEYIECGYCGAKYINQRAIDRKEREQEREKEKEWHEAEQPYIDVEPIECFDSSDNSGKKNYGERPKVNGCGFVFLLVVCWPVGLAYYIFTKIAQNKYDEKNLK